MQVSGLKALSQGAIFLAICNAILPLRDVKLLNRSFPHSLLIYFLTYQTFVTSSHLSRVELHRKLQEKLHHVTGHSVWKKELYCNVNEVQTMSCFVEKP